MSILSLTFHAVPEVENEWKNYTENTLSQLAENLMEVEKYIISEVESDLIGEGINTNLLLVFDNIEKREEFLANEFINIRERVENAFGNRVMIFQTFLNPKKARF